MCLWIIGIAGNVKTIKVIYLVNTAFLLPLREPICQSVAGLRKVKSVLIVVAWSEKKAPPVELPVYDLIATLGA